jgi:hypothetical protein
MPGTVAELLTRTIPDKLWHYTSIRGFEGIVKSKSMFATDLRFLNDREEFVHAREIADKVVGNSPELGANGFKDRDYLRKAVELSFDSGPLARIEVFVASFTAAEDQLGQWRGYSHESSGVSLAFDLKSFRPPPDIGTLALFAPCVYEPSDKEELVRDALHHFKDEVITYRERAFAEACRLNPEKQTANKEQVATDFLIANPTKQAPFKVLQDAVLKTRIDCLRIAGLLKNLAFKEENEWRLVLPVLLDLQAPMKNPPQFRFGKTTLIPYIAHPFTAAALPMVDVILGPGSDENSVFAAQRFLKSHDINITPRLSKVPYRSA